MAVIKKAWFANMPSVRMRDHSWLVTRKYHVPLMEMTPKIFSNPKNPVSVQVDGFHNYMKQIFNYFYFWNIMLPFCMQK